MKYQYRTKGTCASEIRFDLTDGIVRDIVFIGGCNGNLKMIAKLLEGQTADYIVSRCEGNTCGYKSTSCADQLAQAVKHAVAESK